MSVLLLLLIALCEIFHISVNWRSLSGVSMRQFSSGHRNFLSILADLRNGMVFIDLILPLISNSSGPSSKPFQCIPNPPTTVGIAMNIRFHAFFISQARSKYCLFFRFLLFSFCNLVELHYKMKEMTSFFFFLINEICSSQQILVKRLYLKITEDLMSLIFNNGFLFVQIKFGKMVKF